MIFPRSPTAVQPGLREEILQKIKDAQDQSNRITELLKPKVSNFDFEP
jgi:hypothetical protein